MSALGGQADILARKVDIRKSLIGSDNYDYRRHFVRGGKADMILTRPPVGFGERDRCGKTT